MTKHFVVGLACVFVALTARSALAITPANHPPPIATTNASSVVERGGTINAIDSSKQTIVVDGTVYAYNEKLVAIHDSSRMKATNRTVLKPGMKIRFSTVTDFSSGIHRVREIWISQ